MHLLKVTIISLLLVLSVPVMLAACSEQARADLFPSVQQKAQRLRYAKDERTGLCFVYNYVQDDHGFNWDVFTNVPCSPAVESLIQK